MATTQRIPDATASATASVTSPPRQVPVLWLALLATPMAAGANAPVLILPDMARSLGVATPTVTWLVTAFAWAMAVGTPLLAGLLRQRGVGATLKVSSALVVAGTALVATVPWLPLALVGRAGQALGGAGLVAVAMNLAGSTRRMGVITSGFGVLGASGPLLGSLIGDAVSWHAALSISAVSLLAVPVVARYAKGTPPLAQPFDTQGAGLLVALASALILLPHTPLPALGAALVAGALLGQHLRWRPEGFVPAAVLRSPLFLASALTGVALSTSYFTLLFALPRLITDRTGWSTSAIGTGQLIALLAGSALSLLFAAAAARLGRRTVFAALITVGALAPAVAAFATSAPVLLLTATAAVFAATGSNAVLAVYAGGTAPAAQRPSAIGLFVLCYQLGGAFGPAIAAVLVLA
ncbi:MFS transporter [Streptomyces apocyni]|uniref:MFS transporter n=1 Tax=Streptomyces apocyni TaxID=2654677 RepID=UPI0012EA63E0|nr:MFS transporter [Streptomyces apocyni]